MIFSSPRATFDLMIAIFEVKQTDKLFLVGGWSSLDALGSLFLNFVSSSTHLARNARGKKHLSQIRE